MFILSNPCRISGIWYISTRNSTQSWEGEDNSRMAYSKECEGCPQFFGSCRILSPVYKGFQFEGKTHDRFNKRRYALEMGWRRGDYFCELTRSLVIAPVLKIPDFDRSFVVTTDASLVSVGAIPAQNFGQGFNRWLMRAENWIQQKPVIQHMKGSYWVLFGQLGNGGIT